MKQLFLGCMVAICTFAIMPQQAQAQQDAISKYFEQYVDDENFTVVYISSKMFEMLAQLDLEDEDADEVVQVMKDLKGLRILVRDEGGKPFYDEAIKKINFNEYEELMTVRSDGENVKFVVKEDGDKITELLMLVGGKDNFVLMSFTGIIDLQKISSLAEDVDIDIDELDYLEKMNKKEQKKLEKEAKKQKKEELKKQPKQEDN